MRDISYKADDVAFSYRVAGICVKEGRVLLQKPDNDPAYAFPGGQVAFGETHAQALRREFLEETGREVRTGELKWLGELFFKAAGRSCTQLCLYYEIDFPWEIDVNEVWKSRENNGVSFIWVPLEKLNEITVYPEETAEFLKDSTGVKHFIYTEPE